MNYSFILLAALLSISTTSKLKVSSPDFKPNGDIPSTFTCDGKETNPALMIGNIPSGSKSLVLIIEDPDAPGKPFDHWVMWNIPPGGIIEHNSAPGVQGKNSVGENAYKGPCPPAGKHHYHFEVYALDAMLDLPSSSDRLAVETAMKKHILASGELVGLYQKQNQNK